jgi:hypothetical protein
MWSMFVCWCIRVFWYTGNCRGVVDLIGAYIFILCTFGIFNKVFGGCFGHPIVQNTIG